MDNIITNQKPFALEERAMKLCEARASILGANIANASTPNYKARDIDFHQALKMAHASTGFTKTNERHLSLGGIEGGLRVAYRVPMQSSVDENTVDGEIERKNFLENSLRFQAGLNFAKSRAANLIKAIKGE